MRIHAIAIIAVGTVLSGFTSAQESMSEAQQRLKELSFMIGEWTVVDGASGKEQNMSIQWINNQSFISMVAGEYRETIGWDMDADQFVTWAFGEKGGYAKFFWTKASDNAWNLEAKPAYFGWDGKKVEWKAVLKKTGDDSMTLTGGFNPGVTHTATRK